MNMLDIDALDPKYEDAILRGYCAGLSGVELAQESSPAYRLGYRNGRNDRLGVVEPYQLEIIGRMRQAKKEPGT